MTESTLNAALRYFEATEANLIKSEKVLAEIQEAIPEGIVFGDNPEYETNCRMFESLFNSLPKIDGWKPEIYLLELDWIAQNRLDAREIDEIECIASFERNITEPIKMLREYRHMFNQKRRELIRDSLSELIDTIDSNLRNLEKLFEIDTSKNELVTDVVFEEFKQNVAQVQTLLGSTVAKPSRWPDLQRHMHFGMLGDLHDIIEYDWPAVKAGLRKSMYSEKEPVPVGIDDLGHLVRTKPTGPVATKLKWGILTEEDFKRLIFVLISGESGYENPEWLMKTNAPDRGRDLSVCRV